MTLPCCAGRSRPCRPDPAMLTGRRVKPMRGSLCSKSESALASGCGLEAQTTAQSPGRVVTGASVFGTSPRRRRISVSPPQYDDRASNGCSARARAREVLGDGLLAACGPERRAQASARRSSRSALPARVWRALASAPALAFARPPGEGERRSVISVPITARPGDRSLAGNAPIGCCRPVGARNVSHRVYNLTTSNVSHRVSLAFARPPGEEARALPVPSLFLLRPAQEIRAGLAGSMPPPHKRSRAAPGAGPARRRDSVQGVSVEDRL